jgi:hypothetical protein
MQASRKSLRIVFSRKGFDPQYGGIPSVIWPNSREMLSFPIPVKLPEQGYRAEQLSFNGYKLSKLLMDLEYNWTKPDENFHFDPMIQALLPENPPVGALGQSGAALGHLKKNHISKGDVFLFFGTFCECYWEGDKLMRYSMMHPFHAIWGFLEVDSYIDIDPSQSDAKDILLKTHPYLKNHPHIQNRQLYKSKNTIYIGNNFGTFRYDESLRLSKHNFKKSIWELPKVFSGVDISYIKPAKVQKDPPRVDLATPGKGQEFVLNNPNNGILEWLSLILAQKIV